MFNKYLDSVNNSKTDSEFRGRSKKKFNQYVLYYYRGSIDGHQQQILRTNKSDTYFKYKI